MTAVTGRLIVPRRRRFVEGAGGGGKGGGGRAKVAAPTPDTLRSAAYAKVIDVVSEGPIRGLVDGLGSVFFDDTPVQPPDAPANFQGVRVWERLGYAAQNTVSGFVGAETNQAVGTRVYAHSPVVRTVNDPFVTDVRFTVRLPQLFAINSNGQAVETAVRVDFYDRYGDGPLIWIFGYIFAGKTTSPYEKSFHVPLLTNERPVELHVTREHHPDDQPNVFNETWWSFYTEIVGFRLIYPDTAYYAIGVNARDFGDRIPVRGYEVDGLLMKIPANYDPDTRQYSGTWNGQFKTDWTNNPAWVFYLLCTHERFGLGQWLQESQLDKWALYEIAGYCDELVPDGFGGSEPRFTFNGVINTRDEALKVLQLVASCFRGMAYWNGTAVTATQDRPTDPVILVAPANVENGEFDYSGVGYKARHSVAMITWIDPGDGYRSSIEAVEDPDLIHRYGWRPIELVAYGCTSRGQAHRMGKWVLDSEKHSTQTVTYRASFDHMIADGTAVLPGDVILVQDPSHAGVRFGGRLTAAQLNRAWLDAPVTLLGGETYQIHLVMPDGTLAARTVTDGPGTTTDVSFANLSMIPLDGAMWVITASNVAPRQFRVVHVEEVEKNLVQVTALQHDPAKYARVEQGIVLDPPSFSLMPTGPLPAPANLTFVEYLYQTLGVPKAAVTLSWTPPVDSRVSFFEVHVRRPGQSWRFEEETSGVRVDIPEIEPGVYGFRVRSVDTLGNRSPWEVLDSANLIGLDVRPGDVEGFTLQVLGDTVHLSWLRLTDPHLDHYRVKFQSVLQNATWGQGIDLVDRVSRDATGIALPSMIGTYMIKGESATGRQSVNAARVKTNISKVHGLAAIEEIIESPDFLGVKTGTVVNPVSNALQLVAADGVFVAEGGYAFAAPIELPGILTCRVLAELQASSFKPNDTMATWQPLAVAEPLSGADASSWVVRLQISTAQQALDDAPQWSDWQNLVVGDHTARSWRFRAVLQTFDLSITPSVSLLRVELDLPVRVDGRQNVLCPADGLAVTFDPPFQSVPAVTTTLHAASAGDQLVLTDETATGFSIQVVNDGVGVARSFNWMAQGYGHVEDQES